MNSQEFSQYKQEILTKTTGATIHAITGMLGTISECIRLIEVIPEKTKRWIEIMEMATIKITSIIECNSYEYYYCKGYSRF